MKHGNGKTIPAGFVLLVFNNLEPHVILYGHCRKTR